MAAAAVPQPASTPTAAAASTSRPPIGQRRRARPFGVRRGGWLPARRAQAPPPRTPPRWAAVDRPGALLGQPCRCSSRFPSLLTRSVPSLSSSSPPCFPIYSPRPFLCPRLFTFVSSLRSLSSVSFPFVLPVTWKRGPVLRLDLSQCLHLPKDETLNREQSYDAFCLKYAEKKFTSGPFPSVNGHSVQ